MTATILDFGEEKERIFNRRPQNLTALAPELSDAVQAFSYSRLPKEDRVERSLYQVMKNLGLRVQWEGNSQSVSVRDIAVELAKYLPDDVLLKAIPNEPPLATEED